MTSPLQAREQCVEAVARAIYAERWNNTEPDEGWNALSPSGRQLYFNQAKAVLAVLLGTPDTPCPECKGTAEVWTTDPKLMSAAGAVTHAGRELVRCTNCGGSGVVPGTSALRVPCATCEGGGRLYDSDNNGTDLSGIYDIGPCPDCTDGFGLAAIDIARGVENVLRSWGARNTPTLMVGAVYETWMVPHA